MTPDIELPEYPEMTDQILTDIPEFPKSIRLSDILHIDLPQYTIDDIKKAFIAGLNDSQGVLPLSKRFEMYCKRNGIT